MDWLQKLLKNINVGPGTNVPLPGANPPLHSMMPDPTRGPYSQERMPAQAVPTLMAGNQVPNEPPPGMTIGNVPAIAPAGGSTYGAQVPFLEGAPPPPATADDLWKNNTNAPAAPTRRQHLEARINETNKAPAEKQNPWLQALALGLQATQRIADPTNQAGAYQSGAPIEWLGNLKKKAQIEGYQRELAPIYQQQQKQAEGMQATLKMEKDLADINKTRAETRALGRPKAGERITVSGIVYEKQPDGVWKTAEGIPAPPKIRVNEGGVDIEVSPEEYYRQSQSNRRNTETANATREERDYQGRVKAEEKGVEQQDKFKTDHAAWEAKVSTAAGKAQAAATAAEAAFAESKRLREMGGEAEAAEEYRRGQTFMKEAAEHKAEADAERKREPKSSNYRSYTPPKRSGSGKMDRKRDPLGLFN